MRATTPRPDRRTDVDWRRVIAVLIVQQTVIVRLGYHVVRWRDGLWGNYFLIREARSS